jgi:hypothetical protein
MDGGPKHGVVVAVGYGDRERRAKADAVARPFTR